MLIALSTALTLFDNHSHLSIFFPLTFVKRHFVPAVKCLTISHLPKMTANESTIIYIRTWALTKPVPYLLRYISISSDSPVFSQPDLQKRFLCVIADGFYVRTAKTERHCSPILSENIIVFSFSCSHFSSFLLNTAFDLQEDALASFPNAIFYISSQLQSNIIILNIIKYLANM